jgi:hypothetical protein
LSKCFVADIKHGLALFPGTEEEVQETIKRLKRQVKVDCLRPVLVGRDIDEMEAKYMRKTCRLPRRVVIRLSK